MSEAITKLQQAVNRVQDFPIEGILFEDLTPVLADAQLLTLLLDELVNLVHAQEITKVVGIESRGFIFGAALADRLGLGFVAMRKAGKLPPPVDTISYSLEYGTATLELSQGILQTNDKVLLVDDVLATGGTAQAAIELINKQGASVSQLLVVIDIGFFADKGARANWSELEVYSLWRS